MENGESPVDAYQTTTEQNVPDRLEGLKGIDIHVASRVNAMVEELLKGYAKNPAFKDTDPGQMADAVLKGISKSFSKENIVAYLQANR